MAEDPLMSRLRNANPERLIVARDDELKERILSIKPAWRSIQRGGDAADSPVSVMRGWWRAATRRSWSSKGFRRRSAAGAVAAAVLAVVLTVSLSGPAPTVAQAFPVLNGPSVITPTELQRSLNLYGTGPDNAGLDIGRGHAVSTPWGVGYVLTNQRRTFVCVVAPGLNQQDWGASCAPKSVAVASGTWPRDFAYDATSGTARYLALLPQNATAAIQTAGGAHHELTLHDGVLAISIAQSALLEVTIDGHTAISHVSSKDAIPAPAPPTTGSSTATTTTAG